MGKYKPAIFQPTVRPSWGGALEYIKPEELAQILKAIIEFPKIEVPNSVFWNQTIKPDLEQQFESFNEVCEVRGRGARTYWGEHKLSISSPQDNHKNNTSIIYGKLRKDKGKGKVQDKVNEGGVGGENCPPTIEEVLAEAELQNSMAGCGGYKITRESAEEFFTTYALSNWTLHNQHETPIRDWRAALRGWARKNERGFVPPKKIQVAPDGKDVSEFVESWNKFAESIKGSDYWAKCEMATADSVKDLIPIAKAKLESLIATLKTKDPKYRFITPKKSDDNIWEFALDVFRQRRFYSDFLYNECNLTPKFFCNHIDELADPYCDLYLNDSEKHTHSPT